MQEVGIDVSLHTGTVLTDEMVRESDRVITMGCAIDESACPAIRYSDLEDWALPDPMGQPIEKVRAIRDQIEERMRKLIEKQ
jgi:arsenate reductase